jgi:hypothetical protein
VRTVSHSECAGHGLGILDRSQEASARKRTLGHHSSRRRYQREERLESKTFLGVRCLELRHQDGRDPGDNPDDNPNCDGKLIHSEEWGDPLGYSITVNRKGESLETEYSVVPSPAKETPADIIQAYKDKPINLEAFFTGGNPFEEADGTQPKSEDEDFAAA